MKINGFDLSDHAENQIAAALNSGRFPHAVIIDGGSLEEREGLALKTAKALVCESEDEKPCNECNHCRKPALGMHPDVIMYHPRKEKNNKNLSYAVDYIREIRDTAFVIPNEADTKVMILSQAELMNDNAENAFLKILEEPPKFTEFILLCPSKSFFLPTVLSRVMVYSLGEAADDVSANIPYEDIENAATSVVLALINSKEFEIVRAAGAFSADDKLFKPALGVMQDIFSQALRVKYSALDGEASPIASKAAARLSVKALLKLTDNIYELLSALDARGNINLTITRMCTLFRAAINE